MDGWSCVSAHIGVCTHTHTAPSPRNKSDINRAMVTAAGWSLGLMSRAGCGTKLMTSDDLEPSLN